MSQAESWDANTLEYSGDVSLEGREDTPVGVKGVEDMYVKPDSIDGDLRLLDAEYIYTFQQTGTDITMPDPETEIVGNLEDGYAEDVDGSVIVADVEDVFIGHDAVNGAIDAVAPEKIFDATDVQPSHTPDRYDAAVTGWKQSKTRKSADTGVFIAGARNSVTIENATDDLEVYIIGWENHVRIDGGTANVDVQIVGRDNTVSHTAYHDAELVSEAGHDNTLDQDSLPADELIDQSRTEAFSGNLFGRSRVVYQEEVDKDVCPNPACKKNADTIIERKQLDAFFLFSSPIKTYEEGGGTFECEHCTDQLNADVSLTDEERQRFIE